MYGLQLMVTINKTAQGVYCDAAVDEFRWHDTPCDQVNYQWPPENCESILQEYRRLHKEVMPFRINNFLCNVYTFAVLLLVNYTNSKQYELN